MSHRYAAFYSTGISTALSTAIAAVSAVSSPIAAITRPLTTSVAVSSATSGIDLWKNSTTPYSYSLPNTPANDPTCVARWRFETGDSIQDFIGGNALTWMPADTNPPVNTFSKEGASSELLNGTTNYMYRTDANLSSNFPLKSTGSQVGNISGWFYPSSTGTSTQTILAKGDASSGLLIQHWYGYVKIYWMGQNLNYIYLLTPGRWYHFSFNIDGPNKSIGIRIWDDTTQTVVFLHNYIFTNTLTGNASNFTVGGPTNCFNGYVDELIVWNRKLTIAEMELVQEQYFHGDINVENNNFTSDPSCQAIWNFEKPAPTVDSSGKGNNIITDNLVASDGLVGAGTGGKYGSGYGQNTGAYIPDANLANNFPFKSNDTTKRVTVCAWITPKHDYTTLYGGTIFSKKGHANNNGFEIIQDSSSPYNLKIVWGDGANSTTYDTGIALNLSYTYHISVEIDGVNKTIYVEIFNNFTGVLYTFSATSPTQATVSTYPLGIGNKGDEWADSWNGFIDQVVVWNRLLSSAELANVRAGTFICRLLTTAVAAQSQTSVILLTCLAALTSSASAVSSTGAPVLAVERPLVSSLTAVSAVTTPNLSVQRALAALAAAMSATSNINLARFGPNITTIAAQSQAPNIVLNVARLLNNLIVVQANTPDMALMVLRDLATAIFGQSAVSAPVLDLLLNTAIQITTETSGAVEVLRLLATVIAAQAALPDIYLNQHAIWDLVTSIAIQAQIPDIDLVLTFYESLLAKADRYYKPISAANLETAALQWKVAEEQNPDLKAAALRWSVVEEKKEKHLPGDQYNDHEF